jgi:hypothetical protein
MYIESPVEHLLAESAHELLCVDRTNSPDHAGREVLLDAFGGRRGRRAQEPRLELLLRCSPSSTGRCIEYPLGRALGEPLWSDDDYGYGEHLVELSTKTPARTWSALYQQRPAPEERDYLKADWLRPYETMPARETLKIYGASDYAVTADGGDYTVHIVVGKTVREPLDSHGFRCSAADIQSPLRAGYASRGGRLWAAARADSLLGQLTRDELSAGAKVDDVFGEIETLKARLLLDQLTLRSQPLRSANAINAAAGVERELLAFPSCAHSHDDLLARELLLLSRMSLATEFTQQEDAGRVKDVEQIYKREGAGFDGNASPPSLTAVQAALKADEAIVEYFIPYYELHPAIDLWIVVVTKNRTAVEHVPLDTLLPKGDIIGSIAVDNRPPLDASPLGNAIATLRVALQTTDEKKADGLLHLFHRILVEPVVKAGFDPAKFRQWIIVPHGPLHYAPFAALIDEDGKFLIQQVALSTSPSAAVWLREQSAKRRQPSSVAGLFAPVLADPSLPALPSSARETTAKHALP